MVHAVCQPDAENQLDFIEVRCDHHDIQHPFEASLATATMLDAHSTW